MQKQKESLSTSMAKLVMVASLIVGIGSTIGVLGYYLTKQTAINLPFTAPPPKTISAIELSSDAKSILNAETKAVIFTIEGARAYLERTGYAYNLDTFQETNAKYAGNCFLGAVLSNNKKSFIFSSGCLAGDLPQAWIGIYSFDSGNGAKCGYNSQSRNFSFIPNASACAESLVKFLIAGSGKNFVWSSDDKTITYEADLGLSGMTETRTIDAVTGEVLIDVSDWKNYENVKYGFSFKHPADWKITENPENNFENPAIILASPEILKRLEEEKAMFNGENYGISDPAYNILIYYFPSTEEEIQNKANNLGAKNLDELIQRETMTKIGDIKINGIPAIEVTEHGEGEYYAVFIEKDGHLYKVFFSDIWQTENILAIEKKILSTFKFIK